MNQRIQGEHRTLIQIESICTPGNTLPCRSESAAQIIGRNFKRIGTDGGDTFAGKYRFYNSIRLVAKGGTGALYKRLWKIYRH